MPDPSDILNSYSTGSAPPSLPPLSAPIAPPKPQITDPSAALNSFADPNDPEYHRRIVYGLMHKAQGDPERLPLPEREMAVESAGRLNVYGKTQPEIQDFQRKAIGFNQRDREGVAKISELVDRHVQNQSRWVGHADDPWDTDTLRQRLAEAVPYVHPDVREAAVEQVGSMGPKVQRQAYLQRLIAQKTKEYQDEGWDTYVARRLPFIGAGFSIIESGRMIAAANKIRDGDADEDDYAVLADSFARANFEQQKGAGQKAVDMATHIPAFVAEMALTGGIGRAAGRAAEEAVGSLASRAVGATAARYAATGARALAGTVTQAGLVPSLAPRLTAERLVPEINPVAGPDQPLVGPAPSPTKAAALGLTEGSIDVALMHAMGNLFGKEGQGGLKTFFNPVRGAVSGASYMRASEAAKRVFQLQKQPGLTEKLLGGTPEEQKAALLQMGSEAGGFAIFGAVMSAPQAARYMIGRSPTAEARWADLTSYLTPEQAMEQMRLEFPKEYAAYQEQQRQATIQYAKDKGMFGKPGQEPTEAQKTSVDAALNAVWQQTEEAWKNAKIAAPEPPQPSPAATSPPEAPTVPTGQEVAPQSDVIPGDEQVEAAKTAEPPETPRSIGIPRVARLADQLDEEGNLKPPEPPTAAPPVTEGPKEEPAPPALLKKFDLLETLQGMKGKARKTAQPTIDALKKELAGQVDPRVGTKATEPQPIDPDFERAIDETDATDEEKHSLKQLLGGRSSRNIATYDADKVGGVSHEKVRQHGMAVLEKLGFEEGTTAEDALEFWRRAAAAERAVGVEGGHLTPGQLREAIRRVAEEQGVTDERLDRELGNMTPEAEDQEIADKLEEHLDALEATRPKLPRGVKPPSVRREAGSESLPRGVASDGNPPADAPTPRSGPEQPPSAAGGGEAAGSELGQTIARPTAMGAAALGEVTGTSESGNLSQMAKFWEDTLKGMTPEEMSSYLSKRGVPSDTADAIVKQLAGRHPVREATALAHGVSEVERGVGGREALRSIAKSDPEVHAEAAFRMDRDGNAQKLVDDLEKTGRPTTRVETVQLLMEKVRLNQALEAAQKAKSDAIREGKPDAEVDRLAQEVADAYEAIDKLERVAWNTGSEAGGAFRLRRAIMTGDYSLQGLLQKMGAKAGREIKPGDPLYDQIKDLAEQLQKAYAGLAAAEDNLEAAQKQTEANKGNAPEGKGPGEGTPKEQQLPGQQGQDFQSLLDAYHEALVKVEEARSAEIRVRGQIDWDKMPWYSKFGSTLHKVVVNILISSPRVLGKLGMSSLMRPGTNLIEDVAGAMLRKLPGVQWTADQAPRHGSDLATVLKAQPANVKAFFKGFADAVQVLRTGKSSVSELAGELRSSQQTFLDWQFRLHDAEKEPLVQYEFQNAKAQITEWARRQGKNLLDPSVQGWIERYAAERAMEVKFRQKSQVVDDINKILSSTRKTPMVWRIAKGAVRTFGVPILRQPTNWATEVGSYLFGSFYGGGRIALNFARGVKALPPEQADVIMRNLKKGSVGAALMALGYFKPDWFGGFYDPKDKKKPGDPGFMETHVPGTKTNLPGWVLHNPFFIPTQVGSTFRHWRDAHLGKKESEAEADAYAAWHAVHGFGQEMPFIRESPAVEAFTDKDAEKGGWYLGNFLKGMSPQAMKWWAEQEDTDPQTGSWYNPASKPMPRKVKGTMQQIQSSVPWWRRSLPVDAKKRSLPAGVGK